MWEEFVNKALCLLYFVSFFSVCMCTKHFYSLARIEFNVPFTFAMVHYVTLQWTTVLSRLSLDPDKDWLVKAKWRNNNLNTLVLTQSVSRICFFVTRGTNGKHISGLLLLLTSSELLVRNAEVWTEPCVQGWHVVVKENGLAEQMSSLLQGGKSHSKGHYVSQQTHSSFVLLLHVNREYWST